MYSSHTNMENLSLIIKMRTKPKKSNFRPFLAQEQNGMF